MLVANFYPFEFHHMVTFAAKDQKDKKNWENNDVLCNARFILTILIITY